MKTSSLSIGYPSRTVASNINIELEEGCLTSLIGENGVGKSTLLRTLSAFQKPLAGDILIADRRLQDISKQELSRLISVVLTERPDLQNTTIRELVAMGRMPYTGFFGRLSDEDNHIIDECMKTVGIDGTRKVSCISDGERQKVMIARALAQQTPYIFLDEPTAFLDYPSKVSTMEMLRNLAHEYNKTIFLSTHDVEIALSITDRVVMMEKKTSGNDSEVTVTIGKPIANRYEKIDSFTSEHLLIKC